LAFGGGGAVGGGALPEGAAQRLDYGVELTDGFVGAVTGAGHAADRLLHQRAAQVVDAPLEDIAAAFVAQLDPRALDRIDSAVQEQAGHRVHGAILAPRGAGTGQAGQVDRGVLVNERKQHELGETAGPFLDGADHAQVPDPVRRGVDVPVHHRRRGRDAELVRGRDHLDPHRGRQLPLGQDPADVIVQDLGRGTRQRIHAGVLRADQPFPDRQSGAGRPVHHLHR
jgi:hypothetical protein